MQITQRNIKIDIRTVLVTRVCRLNPCYEAKRGQTDEIKIKTEAFVR